MKVSVIIPAYNEELTLSRSVQSILNQTFQDFEIIIIDNGSTDRTGEIIKELRSKSQKIRTYHFEENVGISRALNKGIEMASGIYIARQDADDISYPDRLFTQRIFMDKYPNYAVIGSYYDEYNGPDRVGRKQNPIYHLDIVRALDYYNPIAHPTSFMRKSTLDKIKSKYGYIYSPYFKVAQDYDLWIRINELRDGLFYNDPVVLVRRNFNPNYDRMRDQLKEEILIKTNNLFTNYQNSSMLGLLKSYILCLIPMRVRELFRRLRHKKHKKN